MLYHVIYEAVYEAEGRTFDYGGDTEVHTKDFFLAALFDAWKHGREIDADLMGLEVKQAYNIEKIEDLNARPIRKKVELIYNIEKEEDLNALPFR